MYEMFTLHPEARPKVIVILPGNICYKGNAAFLNSRIIQLSNLTVKDIAFASLELPQRGKLKKADIVDLLKGVKEYADLYGVTTLAVGIADVYKTLTKNDKFMLNFGRALPGVNIKISTKEFLDMSNFTVIPFMNPILLNKYPNKITQVKRGLSVIKNVIEGTYVDPIENLNLDTNEIVTDHKRAIEVLKHIFNNYDKVFVDIETTGLNWYVHPLLTMSFAVDEKNAWSIAIHPKYHSEEEHLKILKVLKTFFEQWHGTFIGHNWIAFDQAFVTHQILRYSDFNIAHEYIIDNVKMEDTMLMAYLLMNSTERPSIGLKELAFKYMGDWDSDIDQRHLERAPLEKVATYNNYDVIATCKIYHELSAELEKEGFMEVYKEFREIGYQLLKMKMNGLRIDLPKVQKFREELKKETAEDFAALRANPYVKQAEEFLARERMIARNKKIKLERNKKTDWREFLEPFNPASPKQKSYLLFELMNLPVISTSKTTKEPSTDAQTFAEWMNRDDIPDDKKETIKVIHDYMLAQKILSTYLENMLSGCVEVKKGDFRIFANFNQTSVISGRLSSSGVINLQTIPSSSKYGKRVKELFIAPDGYVLASSDYAALEDRLVAIESKDPNKLRVFQEHIDGHCLNASAYFKKELEERGIEIDMDDPESINSLKDLAPDLRQKGKRVTFGQTYGSQPPKIASMLNISLEEATEIFNNYWSLYAGIKKYNEKNLEQARKGGFIVSDFSGLRLFTPAINSHDEYSRAKEERVVNNFKIQSGNFLMLRAINRFQKWIEKNKLIEEVKVINTVHDSVYLYIKDDAEIIQLVNQQLIKFMTLPYRENQPIPLEAELDIGKDMAHLVTLKNDASIEDIEEVLENLEEEDDESR